MSKFLQKQRFRQWRIDYYADQNYAAKLACAVYGILTVIPNVNVALRFLQTRSWNELRDPVLLNLFFWGCILLFLYLPGYGRFTLLRSWFICKRELIAHYASRVRIPPPHVLLPELFNALVESMTIAFHRSLRQTTAHGPPHLNLRRKAPFLLFQRAALLLAP